MAHTVGVSRHVVASFRMLLGLPAMTRTFPQILWPRLLEEPDEAHPHARLQSTLVRAGRHVL